MIRRHIVKLIARYLKSNVLSVRERALLTTSVLENLRALPFKDIIRVNEDGSVVVNGKTLTIEQMIGLRESARAVLQNTAYKLIREQTDYLAVATSLHNQKIDDDVLFGKSAIWLGQNETILLESLAGQKLDEIEQELTLS